MKILIAVLLMAVGTRAFSAEFENLAVAKLSFKGHQSDPGCHAVNGCKRYVYEIVAVNLLCGPNIQVGGVISSRLPIGKWYQPHPCLPPPQSSAACSNEHVFKHDEYAVLASEGAGWIYPRSLSDLLGYSCK